MAFGYTNSKGNTYYLHAKGKMFFFAKEVKEGALDAVPAGYNVVEMKTGMPVLKKVVAEGTAAAATETNTESAG
ncbi:MAG: hypothetical protein IPG80_04940 [Anaerolineales bacterium]|jgi:hydroxyethylthiazole kinase-like sugar kinase family protein|uniref:hypothetical protein n=1 Tax=Candidatus Villigracilis vicinus TaxID=3140679 RepID=UPI0031371594|nr:hypothetical protein [Anaerolineales bacterium]MBK7451456.1 hypothetical protein [Anaerolineales bacterium]MBK9779674.1 hypothetical protein [Anaerolineales bacterium]